MKACDGNIAREMKPAILAMVLVLAALQFAVADDFKTNDGKEYKNVTVKRVEPDGIVLSSKSGISKIYFTELPKEVQDRFNYRPEQAAAYSAEQNTSQAQLQNVQGLQAHYTSLQKQEDEILLAIGQAEEAKENKKRMWQRRPEHGKRSVRAL